MALPAALAVTRRSHAAVHAWSSRLRRPVAAFAQCLVRLPDRGGSGAHRFKGVGPKTVACIMMFGMQVTPALLI